jgi:ParB family chromosome partitioning protein
MAQRVLTLLDRVLRGLEAGRTHASIAAELGISRARVTNLARLRALPDDILAHIRAGAISPKHGEALLGKRARDVAGLFKMARTQRLTAERLRLAIRNGVSAVQDPDVERLERRLSEILATSVGLKPAPDGGGFLVIRYENADCLDGILERLGYADE